MCKPTHRNVKFSAAEMAEDVPSDTDFSKMRYLGRGQAAMELARRISQARGEEKRRLIESLPRGDQKVPPPVSPLDRRLEPDLAVVFKDSASVNKALRAIVEAVPGAEYQKRRKTA